MKMPLNVVRSDVDRAAAGRECGTCTACCVLPRIRPEEFPPDGKPGYEPCRHLCGQGCSIYAERPHVCQVYDCLWKSGHISGDERRRPDNLGVMFGMDVLCGKMVIEAWELWEGAAADGSGRWVIDSIRQNGARIAIRYYGVPCSLEYREPADLILGCELSRAARENPSALAAWLEQRVRSRDLENPEQAFCKMDLESLRGGKAVSAHYRPK